MALIPESRKTVVYNYARYKGAAGNALAREVPLRNPRQAREYIVRTDAKSEIEFQESVRSQMEEAVSKLASQNVLYVSAK